MVHQSRQEGQRADQPTRHFITTSLQVIIVGRTEKTLRETAKEIGATAYYVLDTGKTADIEPFIKKALQEHPDIDCLVNNAGVQRPLDINDFDLEKADSEIAINITGPMHLAMRFLPHFKVSPSG